MQQAPEAGDDVRLPADDPGWDTYAEAILVVHGRNLTEVDLAEPIGAAALASFLGAGLAGCFGIMTSDNPHGLPAPAEQNAERRLALAAELAGQGARPVRIDGVSRDRRHVEIGVALCWPLERVRKLACRWQQSAIYWFDGHAMWLVGALTVAPMTRLVTR